MEHLYACLFSNGVVKVGRSAAPVARIDEHATRVRCMGFLLVQHEIRQCDSAAVAREAMLIQRCATAAEKRHLNEWFEGLAFSDVRAWLQEAATMDVQPCDDRTLAMLTGEDVDAQVYRLLTARKGEWQRIAEVSGVVSYSWISKFMNGQIPGAKVDTLKTLRDWLVANPTTPASAPAASHDGGTSSLQGAASEPPAS